MMELDGERLTPLDYAIIGGHQEVAQLLIEQGALSISSIRELAATMIQKCVRGYFTRKKTAPMFQEYRSKIPVSKPASTATTSSRGSRQSPKGTSEPDGAETTESEIARKMREDKTVERRK